jgi:hypothetical protein
VTDRVPAAAAAAAVSLQLCDHVTSARQAFMSVGSLSQHKQLLAVVGGVFMCT